MPRRCPSCMISSPSYSSFRCRDQFAAYGLPSHLRMAYTSPLICKQGDLNMDGIVRSAHN